MHLSTTIWRGVLVPNISLQVTFAPPRTFASAKAHVAANAPELRRYACGPRDLTFLVFSGQRHI